MLRRFVAYPASHVSITRRCSLAAQACFWATSEMNYSSAARYARQWRLPLGFSCWRGIFFRSLALRYRKQGLQKHEDTGWNPKACNMMAQNLQKQPKKPLFYILLGSRASSVPLSGMKAKMGCETRTANVKARLLRCRGLHFCTFSSINQAICQSIYTDRLIDRQIDRKTDSESGES